uniref:Ferritin n=1 Tax=Accipiter nisus TaxID=211598 RepID=A0A8B9MBS7_9AVES
VPWIFSKIAPSPRLHLTASDHHLLRPRLPRCAFARYVKEVFKRGRPWRPRLKRAAETPSHPSPLPAPPDGTCAGAAGPHGLAGCRGPPRHLRAVAARDEAAAAPAHGRARNGGPRPPPARAGGPTRLPSARSGREAGRGAARRRRRRRRARQGVSQVPGLYQAARRGAAGRCGCPMAAPAMAEPRSKRPRVTLPACPAHRPLPGSRVRQSFPPAVEEGLCGVTSALLELAYCLQALGEYFDQSHVALPNVSKFFLHQALEERKAAEALMKYQQERGGHYCSKTIQVRSRQQVFKQLQSPVITHNFLHYIVGTSDLCIHLLLDFQIQFLCLISIHGFVLDCDA